MKKIFQKENLELFMLIMLSSGIIGFIYEEIFYWIDLGYLVKRGSTFGPWIPIYAFGGLLITLVASRWKGNPIKVFFLSTLLTGILEYGTGYILDTIFHIRLWDYGKEILNFGNINGYICLRSVLLFGIAGVLLIEKMLPYYQITLKNEKKKWLEKPLITIFLIFILDMIFYQIIY